MSLPRALAALLVAAASGSCQEVPGTDFTIRFALDATPAGMCASDACDMFQMSCGALLSVRIYDTEDAITGPGELFGATCEPVAPSNSLCSLKNTRELKFFNVPHHHIRVEVAAWNPADLPDGSCPLVPFNFSDQPSPEFRPRPAIGGAQTFDVSSDDIEVEVKLQCTDISRLDDTECQAVPTTPLRAQVDDLANGFAVPKPQAEELNVSAAQPRPVDGSTTARRIDQGDVINLARVDSTTFTTFEHDYVGELTGQLCTLVRDSAAQVTESATCITVDDDAQAVELRGLLVTTETLQPLLAAMGSEFPPTGLVVGKVLDQSGTPLAGVRVLPTDGTVEYLDEAGTAFAGTTTSSNGYFISRDAPYGTMWKATRADGYIQQREQTAGLINDKVTPIIMRMVDPDAPPPGGDDGDDDDDDGDLGDTGDTGDTVP